MECQQKTTVVGQRSRKRQKPTPIQICNPQRRYSREEAVLRRYAEFCEHNDVHTIGRAFSYDPMRIVEDNARHDMGPGGTLRSLPIRNCAAACPARRPLLARRKHRDDGTDKSLAELSGAAHTFSNLPWLRGHPIVKSAQPRQYRNVAVFRRKARADQVNQNQHKTSSTFPEVKPAQHG